MTKVRTVGEVMTANPISISETASLAQAAGTLDRNKITGLPVLDENGVLVGVLSQTDLVRARANQHLVSNWPGLAVEQIMTKPALTIAATATLEEAAREMELHRVHRLVVTDATATPIGIISTSDLVRSWLRKSED
jgi:CBS domain-containing protein